ncbi:MAG: UvrD-helicase domain-containing protein, partial [bacterium]|nr:UvrD-helicase domain-containing protein [bacterium]
MCTYSILEGLNPIQKKAVTHENGPLLVLSGAGSGKTRVITHRIACLIRDRGVEPWQILALTFTNKAAEEMKNRVAILLGMKSLRMWIGTFHSICARILRINAQTLGFTSRFIIFDGLDQKSIIRRI